MNKSFYNGRFPRLKLFILVAFLLVFSFARAQLSITCPSDISEINDPGLCSAEVSYPTPTGSGSGTGIAVSLTSGLPSESAFPVGTNTVTYTVTNNEGDSESCSFNVVVTDVEDPVFDCPDDILVDAAPGTCETTVNFSVPDVSDNCGVVTITQIGGLPSGSNFPVGENNIDFQAEDAAGNAAFCRFQIIVADITDPTITCPDNIVVDVYNACDTTITYTAPVGSDACTSASTAQTGGLGSGSTFSIGTTTEEYTVTDDEGNTATCSFTITVNDAAPPDITCPGDITIAADPDDCEAVVNFADATATDNCPGPVTITQTDGLTSGESFPVGTTTVEYTATDAVENSSTCSFDVTVEENILPEITCPEDITVDTDDGNCDAVVVYTPPTGTDNCPGASTTLTSGLGSGAIFPLGTTTETYTVTDASGNEATCSFDVTVVDNQVPVINCPANITVPATPGQCEAVVNFADATATDNCPGVAVTQTSGPSSGTAFPVGDTVIEFTAEDAAGNMETCSFTITVEDNEDPVITCPADINFTIPGGNCSAVITYPDPTVTDNCPGSTFTVVSGPNSGEELTAGDYTVELEASDAAGNTATCSFAISVEETSIPVFDCPEDITVSTASGTCEAVVTFTAPIATDSCSAVTVSQTDGPASGSTFPVGSTPIEFTAEDEFGNTETCSFNIVVEDDEVPAISCPSDITIAAEPGQCEAVVNFADATATDNCPGVAVTQTAGPTSGTSFPVGDTIIEFTAEDAAGNMETCSFTITVEDNEDPVITCPADINFTISGGDCSAEITYPNPTVTDNCPGSTFTVVSGPNSGEELTAGDYTVELEASDAAGNTATCSFNISIEETSIPVFDCPGDITVATASGTCEAVVTFTAPIATDSCSAVTVSQTDGPASGSTFPIGSTQIEFTAEDEFGNTETCSFNIVVEDDEVPAISCPSDITIPAEPGQCEAVVTFTDATATDNCPGVTVTQTAGPSSGTAFPLGDTAIEFTAEDAAGNTETCSFTITVEDNEDPVITCPADIDFTIPGGDCSAEITYPDPTVTDNCPGATFAVVSGPTSGDDLTAGDYTVELEASDAAGNTATCSFNISIEETSVPVFDCPEDLTISADAGSCEAVVSFDAPTATDSCSTVTVTQTDGPASGSTFPAGSTTVEFTAEDAFGNIETCSFNILVVDDSPPEITCPEDIIAENDPGECESVVNYDAPTASDNCGIASVVQTEGLGTGSPFPVGITTETYVVTDVSGNTDTCSFTIEVVDDELPEVTCPADILEVLPDGDCEAVITYPLPTATDNCGIESLELTSGLPSGSTFPVGENTVTYEATDAAGNVVTCSFTITVQENVDPTITCPADISLPAEADLCGATVTYTPPVGADNCPGPTTTQTAGLGSGSFFPVGTTTETYEVTDASGNAVSCSFTVTITDQQDPNIVCPENITVSNDPASCGAVVEFELPEVTDNCDAGLTPVQTAGPASGDTFPVGSTTITFEATDLSGNTASCSFEVLVEDTELPEITCPADIAVDAASGDCDISVNYTVPTATDNCPGVVVNLTEGLACGSSFPVGVTTVTYEAEDGAGNVASCSFTVTVSEDVPPEITCPDDISVDNDPGACGAVITYDNPVASDNCGDVEVELTSGLESGALFPVGITTVTYTAIDISGNETTCSFNVEVTDSEAPVVVCPDDVTLSAAEDNCGQIYDFNEPEATDNCTEFPAVIQTSGPVSGSFLPLGTTSFEFEITDDNGNTALCSYTVTVIDDLAPEFTECPESFDVFTDAGSCETEVSFDLPVATDNCEVTITQTDGPANGDILTIGTYSYVFTGTDNAGNVSECTFDVNVIDTIPPAISCPESFETCESFVEFDMATATDNCAIDNIAQIAGPESGTDFPVGENTITFEATDASGNTATCSFVVTVLQNAPIADAGADQNICEETETTLAGNDPEQAVGFWSLLSGSGEISSPESPSTEVTGLEPGENTFVWSLDPDNGCAIESDTVTVIVEEDVLVEAGDDEIVFAGSSIVLNALLQPTGGEIIWDPEAGLSCTTCSSPVASPDETTLYFITYTTALGCVKTDSVTVRVFEELPNTITPDGDGTNDVWNIPNIEDYPDVNVVIYNRWGNTIYESTGYSEPWDGTQAGKELPTGSYYYIIDYNVEGKENLNGTVNIIR